jgi:phage repressor protein C with HTH and peptisase S24 domain/DNA-binding XRE family transcriptional regulator
MSNQSSSVPEWSGEIRQLLDRLKITQAVLAEHLGVSPATVSRWLKGSLEPSGKTYVALGNLIGSPHGIYFWERAGMEPSSFPGANLILSSLQVKLKDFKLIAGRKLSQRVMTDQSAVVIPLLNLTAYGDRVPPRQNVKFSQAEVEEVLLAPLGWCPHPESVISMHVCGDSMVPLIPENAIVVVDIAVTDRSHLHQKIAVFSHRDLGFKLARFQRLASSDILVSANHKYATLDVSNASRWKAFGRVLWWMSTAEKLNGM